MATDSASCEPDLSRTPGNTEGATAEAAVTEFSGRREPCRRGLGVVPGSPLDTPLGVPRPFLGCLVFLWGGTLTPRGLPSLGFPFLLRDIPSLLCLFP